MKAHVESHAKGTTKLPRGTFAPAHAPVAELPNELEPPGDQATAPRIGPSAVTGVHQGGVNGLSALEAVTSVLVGEGPAAGADNIRRAQVRGSASAR